MSLDDKLRAIIQDRMNWKGTEDETIAAIKQAYEDEGYEPFIGHIQSIHQHLKELESRFYTDDRMTGQEWYDRFERQYHMSADWIAGDPEMGDDAEHDVLNAARRAAGLDK